MSEVALVAEVVVPVEGLKPAIPNPTQSLAESTTDFIAKYRAQEGTKEPETVVPAVDAPPVETPVEAPESPEKPATPEAESKFRNPDGTFAKSLKAKFGESDFEVPEGLMIPLKRGEVVEMKPLAEVLKEGMLYNDYNKSKQELAEQRRAADTQVVAAKAEMEAWKGVVKDILEKPELALKYRNDPELGNLWADAAEGRIAKARTEALTKADQEYASTTTVTQIRGWAEGMADQFPGVDTKAVLADYGQFLTRHGEEVAAGRALEDPSAISMDRLRGYFTQHHSRVSAVTSPLKAELDALKAEMATLKASQAAETKNKAVQHAVDRAKAPGVIAGAGGAVGVSTGAVTGPNGSKLSIGDASREFLKRYQ